MKDIEAIIPQASVQPTVRQLHTLGVQRVIVEAVQVFKNDQHQTMVYRGCAYEQGFTAESKIRFVIPDRDATEAETIVARASQP